MAASEDHLPAKMAGIEITLGKFAGAAPPMGIFPASLPLSLDIFSSKNERWSRARLAKGIAGMFLSRFLLTMRKNDVCSRDPLSSG